MKAISVLLLASLFAAVFGQRCDFGCAAVEDLVCAYQRGSHRTFNNECVMHLENCLKRQAWVKVAHCACVPRTFPG